MDQAILDEIALFSAVHQDIGALVLIAHGCESQLESIRTHEWIDPEASRFQNKMNMKALGGAIYKYGETYTELMILGLSRAVENAVGHLNERKNRHFSVWSNPPTPIKCHDDVKILRNLGNVIKHNASFIDTATGSQAAVTLVNTHGLPDKTQIGLAWGFTNMGVPSNIMENIYRVETFCLHLNAIEGSCRDVSCDLTDPKEIRDYLIQRYLAPIPGFPN